MSHASPTVHSFDVFETVLVRAVGTPAAVFLLLGYRLARTGVIQCSAEVFARARVAAEVAARERLPAGREEVYLREIYAELAWNDIIKPDDATAAAIAETELERSLLRPVPRARELIQESRRLGREIIFISDMYLPRNTIAAALQQHGLLEPGDRLYVSSEHGALKRTGSLYRTVLKLESKLPHAIVHHGNDALADVEMAAQSRIAARHLPDGNLTESERLLESRAWETGGLSSIFAGASRAARLRMPTVLEQAGHRRGAYIFGATMVGPILVAYTLWILNRAKELNIRRLFFLSRDGYVLYRLAQLLEPSLNSAVRLEYLYGSRRAWGIAGLATEEPGCLDWILRDPGETLAQLFRRLSIAEVSAAKILAGFGRHPKDASAPLSKEDWNLLNRPDFQQALIAAAQPAARQAQLRAVGYLRQSGVMDGDSYAIVDIGWHGSLHACLRRVLAPYSIDFGDAFYFGAYELPDTECRARSHIYYGDGQSGRGAVLRKPEHFCLLEIMTTGLEGTVIDYRHSKAGKWEPVLSNAINTPGIQSGAVEVLEGTLAFAKALHLDPELLHVAADCRPMVSDILTQLWRYPTRMQAEVVGTFAFEGGMGDLPGRYSPARAYSLRETLLLASNRSVERMWHKGSLVLSPPWVPWVIRLGAALRRRVGRLLVTVFRRTQPTAPVAR